MILLRQRYFSEAGKKKLEERARKKANKTKWQLEQAATKSSKWEWGSPFDKEFEKHAAEGKNWLKSHDNQRTLELLEIGSKPDKITEKDELQKAFEKITTGRSNPTRSYRQTGPVVKDIGMAETALRAGRKTSRVTPDSEKLSEMINNAINEGKAGILDRHEMDYDLESSLTKKKWELEREKKKAEKVAQEAERKLQRMKSIKKATPWVVGGALATGAVIGTAKAIKKKKSKDSNKEK